VCRPGAGMTVASTIALPVFMAYSLSAFAATVAAVLRPLPLPLDAGDSSQLYKPLRAGAVAGLALLAFGTGCDNARTFAGGFAANVPTGVFALQNSTLAQQLFATTPPPVDANYLISFFCYVAHECLGGTFALSGWYLWIVAAGLPRAGEGCGACSCAAWLQLRVKGEARGRVATDRFYAAAALALCALGILVGTVGFFLHTATARLWIDWNPALELWCWKVQAGEYIAPLQMACK
jgi:hypothetical protein